MKSKINKLDLGLLLVILVSSFLMFSYYLLKNSQISYFDEVGYINISKMILKDGIFHIKEPLRTYLYPLCISFISLFSNGDINTVKILLGIVQYVVYLITILMIANFFFNCFQSKIGWFGIVIAGFLNPYLIQACTLFLTDILATCFVVFSIYFMLKNDQLKFKFFSIFFIYCATMIRPSSIIFLPVVVFYLLYRAYKDKSIIKVFIIMILLLVIFVPQLYNNVINYNHWTPLIHESLYSNQNEWAVKALKYATVTMPKEDPSLLYYSPFEVDKGVSIYKLIYINFPKFLFIYLSHIFGVIDWGYIDTYIKSFYPSSRYFGSIILYISWYFIFFGIFIFLKNSKENKKIFVILVSTILYILFIATTLIESRFGYPILLLLLPFLGISLDYLFQEMKIYKLSFHGITILVFMVLMFTLSFLLDYQTNKINWYSKIIKNEEVYSPKFINRSLDGELNWQLANNFKAYKAFKFSVDEFKDELSLSQLDIIIINNKGKQLLFDDSFSQANRYSYRHWENPKNIVITVANKDTGWDDSYKPTNKEIKDYFNKNPYKIKY